MTGSRRWTFEINGLFHRAEGRYPRSRSLIYHLFDFRNFLPFLPCNCTMLMDWWMASFFFVFLPFLHGSSFLLSLCCHPFFLKTKEAHQCRSIQLRADVSISFFTMNCDGCNQWLLGWMDGCDVVGWWYYRLIDGWIELMDERKGKKIKWRKVPTYLLPMMERLKQSIKKPIKAGGKKEGNRIEEDI